MESNPDFPKICIIGAGFSGIGAAIRLQMKLGLTSYTIFDENHEVGGTWLVNKYPGCACDVNSFLYSFSFEQNPNWSWAYSPQQEIWNYIKYIANKHNIYKQIKFNHKIRRTTWDEKINKWKILVTNKSNGMENELLFDILICGIGGLRVPHTPDEFLSFKGPRIHSADWDKTISLENKTVAVVGSGASAIQIITAIATKVKKLIVYQRRPAWVVPRFQFEIPDWVKWIFQKIPRAQNIYRSFIFFSNEALHPAFKVNTYSHKLGVMLGNYQLNKQLGNTPELLEKVRPNYEFGCKRITPSNEYFPSLLLPHVEVIRDKIVQVNEHSLVTADGTEKKLDVLILATGFKVQDFFSPLEIFGKGGVNLMDLWKNEGPSSYAGICCTVLPNCFFLLGPNTALGHNSVIFILECQINWMLDLIGEMIQKKSKVICVKECAEEDYMGEMLENLKNTVWTNTVCGTWYSDSRGRITALTPYSCISYWNQIRTPNLDHFDFY